MEKLQLLESVLGKSVKANRDYYQFHCPFCNHPKPKLGISLNLGKWKCWTCDAKSNKVSILFLKVRTSKENVESARRLFPESKSVTPLTHQPCLTLPPEFRPLYEPSGSFFYDRAKSYLLSRGVTENDLVKYRMGYCESGKWDGRVIIPSYDESGTLNMYTGRQFMLNTVKFMDPLNVNKNLILDENLVCWQEPIILVEAKLDAIAVRRNAVPLNGKFIPNRLKEKILNEDTPEVIFCLDGDALTDAIGNAEYFIQHGIKVRLVELPDDHDPSSLGFGGVWKYIRQAKELTLSDVFRFKLLKRLK